MLRGVLINSLPTQGNIISASGKPGPSRRDVYADTSVPRLLPIGAGQELVNGRDDHIIPKRLATDYAAPGKSVAGDRVALHMIPDTGHVELSLRAAPPGPIRGGWCWPQPASDPPAIRRPRCAPHPLCL